MRKLIAFALSQRLLAAVLALALIGLGINAFLNLPVDAFPDISPTQVKKATSCPISSSLTCCCAILRFEPAKAFSGLLIR